MSCSSAIYTKNDSEQHLQVRLGDAGAMVTELDFRVVKL